MTRTPPPDPAPEPLDPVQEAAADPPVAPVAAPSGNRWLLALPLALVALGAAAVIAVVRVEGEPPVNSSRPEDTVDAGPWHPPVTSASPRVSAPDDLGLRIVEGEPLSRPEALPLDPHAATPEEEIGQIEIPALGVSEELNVGMTLTAINRGPSWWPGTAKPGGVGTAVIAGHRTTWSRPFHDLDQLAAGDEVILTTEDGRFTYAVTAVDIIDPSDTSIADQRWEHEAVLFACHPKGSARFRIVARLRLLGEDGTPLDDQIAWRFDPPTFVDPLVALDTFGDEVLGSPDANLTVININERRYVFGEPPPDETRIWVEAGDDAGEPPPALDHLGEGDAET